MKTKMYRTLALATLLSFAAAQPILADKASANSSRYGAEIRTTDVSGYTLTYRLLDIDELNATSVMSPSSSDGGHQKSHHLMVFVRRPDGRDVTLGRAAYVVTQGDRPGSAVTAVPMDGGFGADVDLPFRGSYTITAKLALPEADLVDTFVYPAK